MVASRTDASDTKNEVSENEVSVCTIIRLMKTEVFVVRRKRWKTLKRCQVCTHAVQQRCVNTVQCWCSRTDDVTHSVL